MITDFILRTIFFVLSIAAIPIKLLADVSADSNVINGITTATSYLASWNTVLPLGTVFAILGTILTIELVIAAYKLIMWVIRRLPPQS